MTQRRRLPIGVQSFVSLRRDGFVYVDKTKYIYDLAHASKQYFLSRPRRFGKSLFLSTLKAYWEGKKELFAGLAIVELEQDEPDAWQPHPVFYFDFNGKNYQVDTALEDVLNEHLKEWEKSYGGDPALPLSERFRNLLKAAMEKYGRPCVVLVDEYDKPLLEALADSALEEHNKAVFKGFFGTLKSYDEYLRFVLITGVTKFSKVSIFSDLNQLNDISLLSAYAGICGITEEELTTDFAPEIRQLAEGLQKTESSCLSLLRKKYDGYHFSFPGEGVYNPFSLLKAFFDRKTGSYWFSTGTPTFLVKKLKEINFDLRKLSNRNLAVDEGIITDYRADNPDPVPLLYQTGYLTIVDYDAVRQLYVLSFPNEEVKYGLLSSLLPAYASHSAIINGKDIYALDDAIEAGDTEEIRDILTALFAGIPYTGKGAPFEHYFQSVIYLVFTLLGKYAICELHSSKGRADCVVETQQYVYLFEFKVDKTAAEALSQIEEKGYALPYKADPRQVFRIGAGFDSTERNLTDWQVAVERNDAP